LDGGVGGDDGQRQRQPDGACDDLIDRVGFDRDPVDTEAAGQQVPGLIEGE
jgi:hypothetical protein